jgi:hypothetical protein
MRGAGLDLSLLYIGHGLRYSTNREEEKSMYGFATTWPITNVGDAIAALVIPNGDDLWSTLLN